MTDYTLDATVYQMFTTRSIAGVPTALAGTPVVSAYENDSATQITAGITLGVDHDGVAGLNLLTIAATTANGFESGKDYNLVITTGTVDSVSAVGEVVGAFSIGRSAAAVDLANATDGLGALKTLIDGLNNLSAADVNAEVDTAISDAALATAANLATVGSNVDAILVDTNELQTNQGDWATATGFATAAAITALNDLSAADVNSEVDTAIADAGLATSAALATVDANVDAILVDTGTTIPAQITGLNDLSAADVNAEVDTALSDYDAPTNTEMVAAFTEIKGATFSGTTDSLEAIRDRGDAEWTTGAGGSSPTAADIRAEIDSNSTQLAAIVADTNELQTNQGDWATATGFATAADLVTVDANVDAILVDTGTTIPAQITALNDLDATGVRAAVGLASANLDTQIGAIDTNVDAVLVDTNELQANQGDWATATGFATSGALATVDSNVDAILVDTGTTLPATLSGLSTFDATTDTVDVGAIDGSTTAAARLSDSAETMVLGAAITGTLSTTQMSTDLTEATDDHYNGRVIIWTSGVLQDQATNITDYNGTTKALTYTATTEAPSNGDTFIIV